MKIRKHIEYMHEEEKSGCHIGEHLIGSLSKNLQVLFTDF